MSVSGTALTLFGPVSQPPPGTAGVGGILSPAAEGVPLDQTYIESLPVNGRNVEALVMMSPGITSPAGGKDDGGITANGLRSNTNYYTVDGVSANRAIGGGGTGTLNPKGF